MLPYYYHVIPRAIHKNIHTRLFSMCKGINWTNEHVRVLEQVKPYFLLSNPQLKD